MIVIYGSTTGNCEDAAHKIAHAMGCESKNASEAQSKDLAENDVIILGASTWGIGDLQDDFIPFFKNLETADLSGKKVAIFGTGDAQSYPDSFVDAMADIYKVVDTQGARLIGKTATKGYNFEESRAVINDMFVGLVLDYDNSSDEVDEKIDAWTASLKESL
ncbi:flavodoxin [Chitinivibrio alkaliphilus]|uniref:Flavodoxin n=1 Tax=Chitinivibrio alkaliphilus ACht1 TaxID=1313304 RepID=U7D808_9BACT|nr:flavodoxin [Chitinivibrio alkaliphilus]ERP31222.1 flavodoxin [Chitinivibrio alkaliphilus ACht1]